MDQASRLTYCTSPPTLSVCRAQQAAAPPPTPHPLSPPEQGPAVAGCKPFQHKSRAQITDILSVYRCAEHPYVSDCSAPPPTRP